MSTICSLRCLRHSAGKVVGRHQSIYRHKGLPSESQRSKRYDSPLLYFRRNLSLCSQISQSYQDILKSSLSYPLQVQLGSESRSLMCVANYSKSVVDNEKSCQTFTKGLLRKSRENYHEDCEDLINKQINLELNASYVYMSMAYYFDRMDIAFPGLYKYFKKSSYEEREHAEKLMKYQNMRGGLIVLQSVTKPDQNEWGSPLDAVVCALELEKRVNQALLQLHSMASSHNDPQLCDFLETNFLEEQMQAIQELAEYVTQLERCGKGLGEYIFDKALNDRE